MFILFLALYFSVVFGERLIVNAPDRPGRPISPLEFGLARRLEPIEDNEDPTNDFISRSDYFEGDINHPGLNAQTFSRLVDESNFALKQTKSPFAGLQRSAIRNPFRHWKNGVVPYKISRRYTSYARRRIAAAMADFHEETCIKFVPRTTERSYVYIRPDSGCYSSVGRVGGRQTISLEDGCFRHGVIIHEFMHALGFFHEQGRPDRDDHVTIKYGNIKDGKDGNFQKKSLRLVTDLGLEYDYGSVLHYGRKTFSRNGRDTVVPKERGVEIGQREGFSWLDVERINKLYECPTNDDTTTPEPTPPPITEPEPSTTEPEPNTTEPEPSTTEMPSIYETDAYKKFLESLEKLMRRHA